MLERSVLVAKKEKKIVNITKDDEKSSDRYGKDKAGKIIKLEDKGDYKERAKKNRIIAIILWVIAIIFEIIGILRLSGVINWLPKLSVFWKKANHIDPASEKNKVSFWTINNLGTILSVLAFLPLIIFVLTNKNIDKKDKTIVTVVAAIALVVAGVSSYDFNPVSLEQLEHAEKEVQNVSGGNTVYWAPHSKKYHVDPVLVFSVIKVESSFKPDATSDVGARGLMQLMEDAYDWVKFRLDDDSESFEDMYDPETNIKYGAYYLSFLMDRYDGSIDLTAAAYHCGMGQVDSWLEDGTISAEKFDVKDIPKENDQTSHYVNKINEAYSAYKKILSERGLDSIFEEPSSAEETESAEEQESEAYDDYYDETYEDYNDTEYIY